MNKRAASRVILRRAEGTECCCGDGRAPQWWSGGSWKDEDLGMRGHKPVDGPLCKRFFDHAISRLSSYQ